jgi:predicted acylesterase/phospholipase RssA
MARSDPFGGPLRAALAVTGCGTPARLDAVPQELQDQVTIGGMSHIRYWADVPSDDFVQDGLASVAKEREQLRQAGHSDPLPPAEFLAISGGGENGAFGAGLLVGWSASGTRPRFKAVTGISTGALIAPFAFLGSDYDAKLKEFYTGVSKDDILESRNFLAAIFNDAMADNSPLRRLVGRIVDQPLLDAIAAENGKGRLLLIGTTDLDAHRPVIWNVGKIAASHNPHALKLVQDLLVASAAIPGAFPPMIIGVEAGGRNFQEMHVDGGASSQVFVYPPSLNLRARSQQFGIVRERRLYVIRNARLDPEWAQTDRLTLEIAGDAIASLIQTQGVGDLYRIYLTAQRDHLDFNLAYIPLSFKVPLKEPFDSEYMQRLFQVGYDAAAKGYPWAKAPPGFAIPEAEGSQLQTNP